MDHTERNFTHTLQRDSFQTCSVRIEIKRQTYWCVCVCVDYHFGKHFSILLNIQGASGIDARFLIPI
jgi:hypothetical protein